MTDRPYFNFYPSDWRGDPRLRMCSLAARGLWIDLISYMHEGTPYGHLTIDGHAPDESEIASLVARPVREVRAALNELTSKNVCSRTDGGVIFSRRMVRDKAKRERDVQNGKGGGNPKLKAEDKPPDKPPDNGGVNPQDKAHFHFHSQKEVSEATASGVPPPDPRRDLFDRGLKTLAEITGKTPDSCRSLLGKWLKSVNDEAIHVLAAIDEAQRNRVADPVPWINRVLQPRTHDEKTSPNGFRSALSQLRDHVGEIDRGQTRGGEDARLLPDWRSARS